MAKTMNDAINGVFINESISSCVFNIKERGKREREGVKVHIRLELNIFIV